jgi:tetratricopeptide (TPR) repeat protein
MIRRSFLFIALLVCSFSLAFAADQQWVEVNSPHFSVITDGGEKRAREVATKFEQMRAGFGAIFAKVSLNTAPLEIVAFRNSKELRQFSPLYDGKPVELSGFFLGNGGHGSPGASQDRQYIALDLAQDSSWGTVFHEYAHLLINSNFPPSPVWFDEGFAEYCSTLKVDKKEVILGQVKPENLEILRQVRWLKLVDLLSVGHDSQIYNRGDQRATFYAQSWLTVHFIWTKGLMKQTSAYIKMTQEQRVPVPEAIRRSFGMEPEALQKAVEDYFRAGEATSLHAPAPAGIDAIQFTSHPLNDIDVKSVMADLDYHSRDYRGRGITELQQLLALQPENVTANRDLGYEAMQTSDWDKAGEYFKHAVAHDVKDPQVHYLLAMMMSRNGMGGGTPEDTETIRKELATAIALEPDYAEAYNLLGITLSARGEKEKAIEALNKAIALSPRNTSFVANLVSAYMRTQDFDHAIPVLQQLEHSSDSQTAAWASQQIQAIENFKSAMQGRDAMVREGNGSSGALVLGEASANNEPANTSPAKSASAGGAGPVLSMKGTLVSVDCSSRPVFIVASGGKNWRLNLPLNQTLMIKGDVKAMAGNPCTLKNHGVKVSYRKSGENQGDLLSLDLE